MKPTKLHAVLPLFALAFAANGAYAQGWKPERNVELILPASPGGSRQPWMRRSSCPVTRGC